MATTDTVHAHPDGKRSHLRALVGAVDAAMADQEPGDSTRAAWKSLVDALALGPEPAVRNCPSCGAICMAMASRCGRCWKALTPSSEAP